MCLFKYEPLWRGRSDSTEVQLIDAHGVTASEVTTVLWKHRCQYSYYSCNSETKETLKLLRDPFSQLRPYGRHLEKPKKDRPWKKEHFTQRSRSKPMFWCFDVNLIFLVITFVCFFSVPLSRENTEFDRVIIHLGLLKFPDLLRHKSKPRSDRLRPGGWVGSLPESLSILTELQLLISRLSQCAPSKNGLDGGEYLCKYLYHIYHTSYIISHDFVNCYTR